MNKQRISIWQCLISLLFLTGACSSETEISENLSDEAVSFAPTIGGNTRATDTQFETGDAISVFASTGQTLSASGNYADNMKYSYLNSKFIATGSGIEKPENNGVYYFAVYPYSSNCCSQFTFRVQENQSIDTYYTLSDLSTAATETATTDKLVPLKFSHRLSKVVINMDGANLPSGNITLKLINAFTNAAVSLYNQTFIATGSKGTITMASNGTNSKKAILPPQDFVKGSVLCKLCTEGSEVDVTLLDNISLSSGNEKTLYLKSSGQGYSISETEEGGEGTDIGKENIYGTWKLIREEGHEEGKDYINNNPGLVYYNFTKNEQCTIYRKDKDNGEWHKQVGPFTIDEKARIYINGEIKEENDILLLNSTILKWWVLFEGAEGEYQIQTFEKVSDSVLDDIGYSGNTYMVKSIRGINGTDIDNDLDLTYNADGSIKTIRYADGATMGNEIDFNAYLSRLNVQRNSAGYVTYFDDKYYDNDYMAISYEYDNNNHITRWYLDGQLVSHGSYSTYTYTNDNVDHGGDSELEVYYWNNVSNKANLDFNFLFLQIYEKDSDFHLGLLGLLGKKNRNLCKQYLRRSSYIDVVYTYYDNSCVHTITSLGESYEITYY